ncbi:fimbrial protein [Paraburkholderia bonniea]|uniref:fimbrial protein n=1 Tax=Paraburkholderia bonniea TaxID=2152891 RepID=UPI001291859F|nr:fimbrial protein [Paraburkholderia bonniea]WJF90962.1 fimbrial protein [Paraburkholderia bonniea]WJF94276.1 fimbrial protein [Paraburkholderia bonniea]
MLKPLVISGLVTSLLGFSLPSFASDGTITISGSITDTTCTISISGSGGADATVTLPPTSKSTLKTANSTAGATPFTVSLGGTAATCTDGKLAKMYFDGGDINYVTGNLKNTGTAPNVEVQLVNGDGTAIKIGDISTIKGATIAGNKATIVYAARYISPAGNAGSGNVTSKVTYSMTYN